MWIAEPSASENICNDGALGIRIVLNIFPLALGKFPLRACISISVLTRCGVLIEPFCASYKIAVINGYYLLEK